jgi:peptide/nickel transport system permease protein
MLFHIVGGDPAFQLAGKNATVEQIESIRQELGLNKPLYLQYFDFVKQTLTMDWGRSWTTQQKISSMVSQGIGPSLSLTVPAFILSFIISLAIALFSTYKKGSWVDRSITTVCLALMSISFLVYIIFYQYALAFQMGWFPITGWDPSLTGRWTYLVLPWIISVSVSLGPNILIYRTALLDEVFQDYVRTARAKGVNNKVVYFKHILKNALIPIITIVVMQMPFLITGSLLLEAFFSIPGLGGMLIQAINNSDFPVIKAMTVIGSILYMVFNLFSDLLYAYVDPRVELK